MKTRASFFHFGFEMVLTNPTLYASAYAHVCLGIPICMPRHTQKYAEAYAFVCLGMPGLGGRGMEVRGMRHDIKRTRVDLIMVRTASRATISKNAFLRLAQT